MSSHVHTAMELMTTTMAAAMIDHSNHTGMGGNHTDPHAHHHNMNGTMNGTMDHGSMNHSIGEHGDHTGHGDHVGHGAMDGGDHSMHDMGMGHMMKMYFHTGDAEYILFEDLLTDSTATIVGACIAIFAVAILYEGLKFMRERLLQNSLVGGAPGRYTVKESNGNSQEHIVMEQQSISISSRILSSSHFVQTLLHMVQVFISYCLMLVFMTYNVWLCLAIILGAGLGYFLFGWRRSVVIDSSEHCH